MTWIPDQWMLFILNYIIHSAVLISMVFILIRFRPFSELKMREGLWKFALVAGIITTLIQSYGNTSLLIISAAPVHQVASNSDSQIRILVPMEVPAIISGPASEGITERRQFNRSPIFDRQIWAMVVFAISVLLIARFVFVRRRFLRSLQMIKIQEAWPQQILNDLVKKSGYSGRIELFTSFNLKSPVAISNKKICIPDRAVDELSHDQMKYILAHELAHIFRKDPLWLFLINLITSLFYFQPLNLMVRRKIRDIMEDSADELAVWMTGDALAFSETLVTVARWGQGQNTGRYSLSFASKSSLQRRVSALLEKRDAYKKKPQLLLLIITLIAVMGLVSFVSPEIAIPKVQVQSRSSTVDFDNQDLEPIGNTPNIAAIDTTDKSMEAYQKLLPEFQSNVKRQKLSGEVISLSLDELNAEHEAVIKSLIVNNSPELIDGSQELYESLITKVLQDYENTSKGLSDTIEAQGTELNDLSLSMAEMARLRDINYENFKKDFWPMLVASGLLKKRGNTVEITHEVLTVNGRRVRGPQSQSFRLLIETHFDQEFWSSFQYKRERFSTNEIKRSISEVYARPQYDLEAPSEFRDIPRLDNWSAYRSELASTLYDDRVIKSMSENISVKWRNGKVFINRKKFTGDDYLKYRSIKNKYFPVRVS